MNAPDTHVIRDEAFDVEREVTTDALPFEVWQSVQVHEETRRNIVSRHATQGAAKKALRHHAKHEGIVVAVLDDQPGKFVETDCDVLYFAAERVGRKLLRVLGIEVVKRAHHE